METDFQIPTGNSVLLHCIRLLSYLQEANDVLEHLTQANDGNETKDALVPAKVLQVPKEVNSTTPKLTESIKSNESIDPAETISQLSSQSVDLLIKRSVVLMMGSLDIGSTSESVIDILSDVLATFMQKLTKLLRVHADTSDLKAFEMDTGDNQNMNGFHIDTKQRSRPFKGNVSFELIEKTLEDVGYSANVLRLFEQKQRAYRDHLLNKANRVCQRIKSSFNKV